MIKKTVYPTQQELKEAVEDYLEENNYDFLQGFRNRKSKWDAYYEKNFYNPVNNYIYIFIFLNFFLY